MAIRRLQREPGTVRPRTELGRVERATSREEAEPRRGRLARDEDDAEFARGVEPRDRRRPPLAEEFADVNRGATFAGVEGAAIALDVMARVLRGAVDRAFDEDYDRPGDLVRSFSREADLAVYDLVHELRAVPRRLSHRFDEAVRSPRADQGERARRSDAAESAAESPAAAEDGRPRRRLERG